MRAYGNVNPYYRHQFPEKGPKMTHNLRQTSMRVCGTLHIFSANNSNSWQDEIASFMAICSTKFLWLNLSVPEPYYACRALFKFWRKKHYCFLCQLHTSPYRVPKNKHLSQPPLPHVIVLELSCLKQYHNKNAFDKLRWKRELFHRGDIDLAITTLVKECSARKFSKWLQTAPREHITQGFQSDNQMLQGPAPSSQFLP